MSFLKRLFAKSESIRPEDYRLIYVRWDKRAKEYGPLTFSDLLTRSWSGPPLQARFEDESKWSDYDRILGILDRLVAPDEQVEQLLQKGILTRDAPRPLFKEAITHLDRIATEERVAKAKLPATAHIRKKMDGLGIAYPNGVTRAEARALVKEHEERAAIHEAASELRNRGVLISDEILCIAKQRPELTQSVGNQLDEILYILEDLQDLGVTPEVPNIDSIDILRELTARYREALSEADNVEFELEEKRFFVGDEEFRLLGTLPRKGILAIKRSVVQRCIAGSWNSDMHILELVAEHMPKVRVKNIDDETR